jgi:hypothetical protein
MAGSATAGGATMAGAAEPPASRARCWVCGNRPADDARHPEAATGGPAAPEPPSLLPAFMQCLCGECGDPALQPYDAAWGRLSAYLHEHWGDIAARGSFDLSKPFHGEAAAVALNVHLFFVKVLGCKLFSEAIQVNLTPFATALRCRLPHPDVTLLVANTEVRSGQWLFHDSSVSVLRSGDEVYSAMWTFLAHPVAIKICYLKSGAPVREPDGFPWHPMRQRKIVKLSPYKAETQPLVARRDLRI